MLRRGPIFPWAPCKAPFVGKGIETQAVTSFAFLFGGAVSEATFRRVPPPPLGAAPAAPPTGAAAAAAVVAAGAVANMAKQRGERCSPPARRIRRLGVGHCKHPPSTKPYCRAHAAVLWPWACARAHLCVRPPKRPRGRARAPREQLGPRRGTRCASVNQTNL